jgi:hypothetical protein
MKLDQNLFNDFPYQINNNYYLFNVHLVTFDGRLKQVNPDSIKQLVIEDDFQSPFHKGYIVLDNKFDNLEQTYLNLKETGNPQSYIPGATQNTSTDQFFLKGDCRDVLRVVILPKLDENTSYNYSEDVLQHFLLFFEFSIYNEEDIKGDSLNTKLKKLYFWDYNYEILREKNSYFSTANTVDTADIEDLSNGDRAIKTGTAIKELLKNSFDDAEGAIPAFSKDFDEGSTSIFFSAPAQYKAIDSLNYLLSRHVSNRESNFDPGVLRFERYPKEFSLISLKKYFDNAVDKATGAPGVYFLEEYKITGYNASKDGSSSYNFSTNYGPQFAPYFRTIGNISTYSFDNMAGLFSQDELVPKIVHFYSYNDKQFEIDSERNASKQTFDALQNNYINCFNGQFSPTILAGNYRETNKNTKNIFASVETSADQRLSLGRSKFFNDYVMNNNVFIFRVIGSTHRQAGRFISITRDTSLPGSDFDKKVLGVYLIVNVKHIFENANYFNDVVCVKTYLNEDIFLNKNTI